MRILIACEFSGIVREAFLDKGHVAYSCDLLPSDIPSKYHIQGNVLNVLDDGWDMMIAHPPCTYLANSGVRWLYKTNKKTGEKEKDLNRWKLMEEGALFFKTLMNAPIHRIAIENPIMHKYAIKFIGRRQDQLIQPHEHGHAESKSTCLWLKNLPKIVPSNKIVNEDIIQRVHWMGESVDRWKKRSITYPGIAKAFANQWG